MSKVDAFDSTPLFGSLRSQDARRKYWGWFWVPPERAHERSLVRAKRVLGKQDYCWTGTSRNYIWEGPFEVTLNDGERVTRHWRLFVSKRGFSLEVEMKPGENIAEEGLDAFLNHWKARE